MLVPYPPSAKREPITGPEHRIVQRTDDGPSDRITAFPVAIWSVGVHVSHHLIHNTRSNYS